jgi:Ca2+-binding EF-hand superfamily protein
MVLFEYMKQSNLRLVDFFHVLDRDKSDTISKEEFREGLQVRHMGIGWGSIGPRGQEKDYRYVTWS